jgi:hypothetical protein
MRSKRLTSPSRAINRRDFLRLGGIGMAGATLLGIIGSGKALAQGSPDPSLMKELEETAEDFEEGLEERGVPVNLLVEEFEEAADTYDVPEEILFAMAYVNTRLEMPPPEASAYEPGDLHGRGAYGIMQLVQNDTADTLGEASRLTGIPEEKLKTDRRSNILGGAALLGESQGDRPERLGDYFGAVAGQEGRGEPYEAVAGVGAGQLYAEQVFETLRRGISAMNLDGEQVDLPPREGQL